MSKPIFHDMEFSDPRFPDYFDEFTAMIVTAMRINPLAVWSRPITPFATAEDLMVVYPPSRWRPFARRAWFKRFARRVRRVLVRHHKFAAGIEVTVDRTRRDLRAIATMIGES